MSVNIETVDMVIVDISHNEIVDTGHHKEYLHQTSETVDIGCHGDC